MCALALADPLDDGAAGIKDEYWLGPDLLVAPVLAGGARSRSVHLPRGADFVDLWRATRYEPATRSLEPAGAGPGQLLEGGRRVDLPAPLEEIPVLVRAGAVLPLLSAEVDTLSSWGTGDFVHCSERDGLRRLLAFPRGVWSGGLGVDERITSTAGRTGWRVVIEAAAERLYELRADLGYLEVGVPAGLDLVEGKASWSYDPATGVLVADVASRALAFRFTG